MTDAAFTLKQTNSERKRVGRGALAKKNGSKSKRCTLPSDNMTASEIKKLNGECKSYELSKPMKWNVFKTLPHDLQGEYIKKLAAMGASRSDVCDMFGVKPDTYSQYMNYYHKGTKFFDGKKKSNDEFVEWFCGESGIECAEEKKPEEPVEVDEPAKAEEPVGVAPVEAAAEKIVAPVLSSGSMTYTGDPKAIFERIMLMLDGVGECKITVNFEQIAA